MNMRPDRRRRLETERTRNRQLWAAIGLVAAFSLVVAIFNVRASYRDSLPLARAQAQTVQMRTRSGEREVLLPTVTPSPRPRPTATARPAMGAQLYRATAQEVWQVAAESSNNLRFTAQGKFAPGQQTTFTTLAETVGNGLERLQAINPPEAYAEFHWQLVETLMCFRDSYTVTAAGNFLPQASDLHVRRLDYNAELVTMGPPW